MSHMYDKTLQTGCFVRRDMCDKTLQIGSFVRAACEKANVDHFDFPEINWKNRGLFSLYIYYIYIYIYIYNIYSTLKWN